MGADSNVVHTLQQMVRKIQVGRSVLLQYFLSLTSEKKITTKTKKLGLH